MKQIAVLIPTFNNFQFLESCLKSLLWTNLSGLFHIYIINNGHPNSCDFIEEGHPLITILQTNGKNLGWEGGLKFGVEQSKEPFVCFLNDDTHFPQSSTLWANQLLSAFKDPKVGAIGPATNVVMGSQNIFIPISEFVIETNMLIGFCILIKRKALIEAGGVDASLPGGDDLDLSIRLRKAGYKLLIDRRVFIYHHGFKTGEKVKGTPDKINGWNSYEMKERTDTALIRKHGFREWFEVIFTPYKPYEEKTLADLEGNLIRDRLKDQKGKIVELGCGGQKTMPNSIGIDLFAKGERIETMFKTISVADIKADVQKELPFEDESIDIIIGRHILEHMVDPIGALKLWISKLKKGGKLVLALPDHDKNEMTIMNIEHVHAYTQSSAKKLLEFMGLKVLETTDTKNTISFLIIAEKT